MNTVFNTFKKFSNFSKKNNNNNNQKLNIKNKSSNYNLQSYSNKKNIKNNKNIKDTYSIINYPSQNQLFGEFIGSSPKRAAHKAFSKLAKISNLKNNSEDLLVFSIINKRTNKIYKYIGKRIKLSEPREVMRNGKKIIYKYVNTVGKYKKELNQIK